MSLNNILVENVYNLYANTLTLNELKGDPGNADTLWLSDGSVKGEKGDLFLGPILIGGPGQVARSNISVYAGSASITVLTTPTYLVTYGTAIVASTDMNTSTGIYTVPVTGVYLVSFQCNILPTANASGDTYTFVVAVNGSVAQTLYTGYITSSSPARFISSAGSYMSLTAGDQVKIGATDTGNAGDISNTIPYQFGVVQVA